MYGPERRARIAAALIAATPDEYCRLNFDLGEWLAQAAVEAIAESGVPRSDVAAIASHGQTIWHVPGHSTRSEEHTSELQSLMRISYAVFCLTTKNQQLHQT